LQRWLDQSIPSRRGADDSAKERSIQDHKFPPTPVAEVENKIDRLRRALGRFHDVRARELAPKIFEIARH
jgi:hypothetical protein